MKFGVISFLFFFIISTATICLGTPRATPQNSLSSNAEYIHCQVEFLDSLIITASLDRLTVILRTPGLDYYAFKPRTVMADVLTPFGVKLNVVFAEEHTTTKTPKRRATGPFEINVTLNFSGEGLLNFKDNFYYLYNCKERSSFKSLVFPPFTQNLDF